MIIKDELIKLINKYSSMIEDKERVNEILTKYAEEIKSLYQRDLMEQDKVIEKCKEEIANICKCNYNELKELGHIQADSMTIIFDFQNAAWVLLPNGNY